MSESRLTPKLAIVIPCYNEEEVINKTIDEIITVLNSEVHNKTIKEDSFVYLVDDGSTDSTWKLIEMANSKDSKIKGLKLSRNFGHQYAVLAGMEEVRDACDCVITIDADLQQDQKSIPEFIDKYKNGADIVFGIRKNRKADGFVKKYTASQFYKFMGRMGHKVIVNHADYRLVGKNVLDALENYREVNIFLRGIFSTIGFKTDYVLFEVKERYIGKSKYTYRKMLALAIDGITSFSVFPLRIVTLTGFMIFIFSLAMSFYVVYQALLTDNAVPGWASTILPIYFIGGVQLLAMGVIGEYVGKIYKEAKSRPRYIKDKELL